MTDHDADLDELIAAAKQADEPPAGGTKRAWTSLRAAIATGAPPSVPVNVPTTAKAGVGLKGILAIVGATVVGGTALTVGLSDPPDPTAVHSRAAADREGSVPPAAASSGSAAATVARVDEGTEPARAIEPSAGIRPARASSSPTEDAAPHLGSSPRPGAASPHLTARPRRPTPSVTEASSTERIPSEPLAPSTLAAQAKLLGRAWRAVDAGQIQRGLDLVGEHARRFPDSPLAPEREACQLVAWCQGNQTGVDRKVDAFLARHTGTPAARVRKACKKK